MGKLINAENFEKNGWLGNMKYSVLFFKTRIIITFYLSRSNSENTCFRAGNYTGENKVSRVNLENVKNELHVLE